MTITLPQHRQDRLLELLQSTIQRKSMDKIRLQKLLGELRSMALALPGSHGCFSFLQDALSGGDSKICVTPDMRQQLRDLLLLAQEITSRPTHLNEIVPKNPSYFGAMDASKIGMGGVWLPPTGKVFNSIQPTSATALKDPILWRSKFPPKISDSLVSDSNPSGRVNNSDLELAGTIAHDDVLASTVPVSYLTLCSFCDNTPAVAWRTKGSTSNSRATAHLLQVSAFHRRRFRYQSEIHYIPGAVNTMADDCSRLFNLSDSELIHHFNSTYPQATSWQMRQLRPEMNLALTSALLEKRPPPESFLPVTVPLNAHGVFGVRSAHPLMSTHSSRRWPTLSSSYNFSESVGGMGESLPAASLTGLARWRTRFALSARNLPVWGPRTLV